MFLTRDAQYQAVLDAQRANIEVLQLAHNLAPCVVVAIVTVHQRFSAELVGLTSGL